MKVSVSPSTATLRAGTAQPFSATVTGSSNMSVTWQVNGVTGGAQLPPASISASGVYTAPAAVPSPNSVTVQAVSSADSSAAGQSAVTLQNPIPVLASIAPMSVTAGAFTITVTGSNFVSGAQVELAGSPLNDNFCVRDAASRHRHRRNRGQFRRHRIESRSRQQRIGSLTLQVTSSGGGNPPPPPPPLACNVMQPGQGGSLGGFVPFPADNLWNKDISGATVDPNSAAVINFIGTSVGLHADFGAGEFDNSIIGIPYQVVDSTQGPVTINFTDFGDESDPGPMPIPLNAPIEGDPNPSGDQHVLILDNASCFLYELYNASPEWIGVERGFRRRLGPDRRRAATLHLDVGRRCGTSDFSGPRALRRNRRRRDQSRVALHAAEQPRRVHAARLAPGSDFIERQRRADGHAPAAQIQLRYFGILRHESDHPECDEEVRPDHGR